jgi:diguanylate cyclase (GGDEF)-like protein
MKTHLYSSRIALVRAFQFFGFKSIATKFSNFSKRAFDIIMAAIGLLLLTPVFAFVAIMIKRDSPGPIFYWGPRIGRNGKIFRMLKFRTMYEHPQSYTGPRLTSKGDPRVTPLGGWLRDTKINELPQLWNVLIGEMSFVGPRPEDPEIAKNWPEETRSKILSVRPGITSPASILYHDEEKLLSQKDAMSEYFKSILPDKLRLDLLYVRHHAFFSDVDTIFWTLAVLLPRWAKTRIPEGYFFAGPFSRLVRRYVNWFVMDLIGTLAVIGTVTLIWRTKSPLNWGSEYILLLAFTLAFLFSGFNSIVGLNRIAWSQATAGDIVGLVISAWLVTFSVLAANYMEATYDWLAIPPLPTSMIYTIGFLLQLVFIITRFRLRLLMLLATRWMALRQNNLSMGDRVLIIGNGESSQIAQWLLGRQMFRTAFSIVGIVNDDDPMTHGMRVNGSWMLGSINDVPDLIKKHDVGVILSTVPSTAREVNKYVFEFCQNNNIRLIFLNDLLRMVEREVTQPVGSFEYPIWLDEGLEFKAMHDAITSLPNRFLFQNILKRSLAYAKRYSARVAVMFISLDGLEPITDKFGCTFSDQILVRASLQLTQCKRESDTLARIEGNKFALILENIVDEGSAEVVKKRILNSLSAPLLADKQGLTINTSVNVYLDKDGYDELEIACNAELGIGYPFRKMAKVDNQYERVRVNEFHKE